MTKTPTLLLLAALLSPSLALAATLELPADARLEVQVIDSVTLDQDVQRLDDILLLDEPTASLDAETEARVVVALEALVREGRTLVIATHHPALIAMAGRRLAIEAGRVTEVPHG